MAIKDNFSIFNLFLDKKVKIITSDGSFFIRVPTVKEFSLNDQINAVYHILGLPEEKRKHLVPFEVKSSLDLIHTIIFKISIYKEYNKIAEQFCEALKFFIPDVDINYELQKIIINNITINEEI